MAMRSSDYLQQDPEAAKAELHACGIREESIKAVDGLLRRLAVRFGDAFDMDRWVARLVWHPTPGKAVGAIERFLEAWEEPPERGAPTMALLEGAWPIWSISGFLSNWLARRPDWALDRTRPGWESVRARESYLSELRKASVSCSDRDSLMRVLREFKYREYLRLTLIDLESIQPMRRITQQIADLADAVLEVALAWFWRDLAAREGAEGTAGCPMAVLAMGKHGARELNYSSDIDIVFVYDPASWPSGWTSDSSKALNEIARNVITALNDATGDGIVFRVDMRLRPGGNQAPLAQPLEMAVDYYLNWGHTWERGALIKARPCAGDPEVGARVLSDLQPFVYRRYLDFATLEDIRAMKDRIDRQSAAASRPGGWDVKLGAGGIREAEFSVQNFQLIHAGRSPELRVRSTLEVLKAIERLGLMPRQDIDRLKSAYIFLRDIEHRLQMIDERQTQWLPDEGEQRQLAFRAMPGMEPGRDADREIADRLAVHQGNIARIFNQTYRAERDETAAGRLIRELPDWVRRLGEEEAPIPIAPQMASLGFRDSKAAVEALERLHRRSEYKHLPSRAVRDLLQLVPLVIAAAAGSADPDASLQYFERFLGSLGGNTHSWALLRENPRLMDLLANLFAGSAFLSRFFLVHPELMDSLVMGGYREVRKSRERLADQLARQQADARDYEDAMILLRKFRNEETLRIGLADLAGDLDILEVNEELTRLAEVCLPEGLRLAVAEMGRRLRPEGIDADPLEGLAILALGKMGGREMNYSSDLDLIFIYDEETVRRRGRSAAAVSGGQAIPVSEYYIRLVQKFITTLSSQMREGRVYEIDTRLRPSGSQGTLVVSLDNFIRYHHRQAQTWERQSLLKARPVAGSAELGRRIAQSLLPEFVYARSAVEIPALARDLYGMRMRMERELAGESLGQYNVKFGPGGLVDIEFLVQFLQLAHGKAHPALRQPGTFAALGAAGELGLLDRAAVDQLAEAYLFWRRVENRLRITEDRSVSRIDAGNTVSVERLARALGYGDSDSASPTRRFLEDLERIRRGVRQRFDAVMKPPTVEAD